MELTDFSAVAMAKLVCEKQISPVELMHAHLARVEQLNPILNAVVHLRGEQALDSARAAERDVMRGDLKPLSGVPISIKSCIDVEGTACEAGLRARANYIAESDAVVVARMRQAGAIVIGTTNTAESLLAYNTDNPLIGRTNNPWALDRTAGGSSGGESAAIASGMSAAGFGSDGGGSVRVPAHFTGICALKPTPGRLPGTGHFPECIGPWAMMGVVGPMARSVEDLRAIFDATEGPEYGDPFSASFAQCAQVPIEGARIGILQSDAYVSPDVENAVQRAAAALEEDGAVVEPFRFPRFDDALDIWQLIFVRAAYELIRDGDSTSHGATLRDFMDYAASLPTLTTKDLLTGLMERDRIRAEFLRAVGPFAALISPPASDTAFRHEHGGWGPTHPADYIQTMRYAQFANVLGLPAIVVPVCRSREELPIGVQLLGKPYEEHTILYLARTLEERFGYTAPPLIQRARSAVPARCASGATNASSGHSG